MTQIRFPSLLLLTLLLVPACQEPEQPVRSEAVTSVMERAVRIQQPGGNSPHHNVHHVSHPVLLVDSGRFYSAPFAVPAAAELEIAFGISGGQFTRRASLPARKGDKTPRPVVFTLSFQPLDGTALQTLHQETLDAALDRNRQWWIDCRIDLSPLNGASGRFVFEIGPVPEATRPVKPRHRPVPVWAESILHPKAAGRQGRLIILVSADTCRADALGCYGQARWTTPHLDGFSRHCVLFENAYGPSPWTLPSHASLLTATYPNVHQLETYRSVALSPQIRTLTEVLADNGFLTAAFIDMGFITPFKGLHRGFDIFDYRGTGIDEIGRRVLPWILDRPGEDLFVFFHFYDMHFPYDEQIPGRTFGAEAPPPGTDTRLLLKNRADDTAVTEHLHDLYHNGVVYTDEAFGRFLTALRASGLYREALIVFLSDHGEEFGEHGRLGHQLAVFQESLAVPLLIKLPGNRKAGSRSPLPASLVDLMPTILGQAGLPSPTGGEGIDLLGPSATDPDTRFVFGETVLEGNAEALIGRRKKLIHQSGSATTFLDLAIDPGERDTALPAHPQERLDTMSRALITGHLWRRPGLHIWLTGLKPGTPVEISIKGRGLQAGTALPFWASLPAPAGEQVGDVWRARLTPLEPFCGLVLGVNGVPPAEVIVKVTAADVAGVRPIPLILPRDGQDGEPSLHCRCPRNTSLPGTIDLDLLDGSRTPLGLVHYRSRIPAPTPVVEEDPEVTDRLRQLGYLE